MTDAACTASVPDQEHILQKPGQKSGLLPSGNTAAAVGAAYSEQWPVGTVAAEVGPYAGMQVDKNGLVLKYTDKDLHDTEAATIERCAQVAEWFSNVEKFTAEDVAARIRALKDKP